MYAMGCLLFHLVTGRLPFEGEDRLATGYRRVHEDPPDARAINPKTSTQCAELIRALLVREPDRRPGALELMALLSGQESSTIGPTVAARREPETLVGAQSKPTLVTTPHRGSPRLVRATVVIFALALLGGGVAAAFLIRDDGASVRTTDALPRVPATSVETRVITETQERIQTVRVTTEAKPAVTADDADSLSGLEQFRGSQFDLLYPAGWIVEAAEVSKGTYLDTTVRNPSAPAELVRVDVTASSYRDPMENALEVEGYLVRQRGYQRLAMERTSLNGFDAVWWEFTVPERGVTLHKVDVFFTDAAGSGFAILTQASASTWAERRQLYDAVRDSLAPRG